MKDPAAAQLVSGKLCIVKSAYKHFSGERLSYDLVSLNDK